MWRASTIQLACKHTGLSIFASKESSEPHRTWYWAGFFSFFFYSELQILPVERNSNSSKWVQLLGKVSFALYVTAQLICMCLKVILLAVTTSSPLCWHEKKTLFVLHECNKWLCRLHMVRIKPSQHEGSVMLSCYHIHVCSACVLLWLKQVGQSYIETRCLLVSLLACFCLQSFAQCLWNNPKNSQEWK